MTTDPLPEDPGGSQADPLHDLPRELWHDLVRVFRRAIEPLEDAELPPALRPFRGWKPDRLLADRPRRAVADALGGDARLRERLADQVTDTQRRTRLRTLPLPRLVAEVGEERTATLLVASGRWSDLATLAADVGARIAARQRAAAEQRHPADADDASLRRLEAELAATRKARDRERSAREQAEHRARSLDAERDTLMRQIAELETRAAGLERTLRDERSRHRDRLERARRRASEAVARATVDEARIRGLVDELERLTDALRLAVDAPSDDAASGTTAPDAPSSLDAPSRDQRNETSTRETLPRTAPPAEPGRPCGLPPGLTREHPTGVQALLGTPGITLVLDGYNITKDPRGVARAPLAEQRQWLVRLAAGVVGRYRVRVIVVFDSELEDEAPLPSARGVSVDFATEEESADDRIVGLVEAMDASRPVLVVTSDRELADRCGVHRVDVVPSGAFLSAAS